MTLIDCSIDLKEMMEVGIHFGHRTQHWNPKMSSYIFTQRKGVHVINLPKTVSLLREACDFVTKAASSQKHILIVGTKSQTSELVAATAQRARCHYINHKWLGGILTNWSTTKLRLHTFRQLEIQEISEVSKRLPKKEFAVLKRRLRQLRKYFKGLKYMTTLPDVVIVVDQQRNSTAIQECLKLDIPVICLLDTNCDPDLIHIPIPTNTSARKSIRWILNKLALAILTGRMQTLSHT